MKTSPPHTHENPPLSSPKQNNQTSLLLHSLPSLQFGYRVPCLIFLFLLIFFGLWILSWLYCLLNLEFEVE